MTSLGLNLHHGALWVIEVCGKIHSARSALFAESVPQGPDLVSESDAETLVQNSLKLKED